MVLKLCMTFWFIVVAAIVVSPKHRGFTLSYCSSILIYRVPTVITGLRLSNLCTHKVEKMESNSAHILIYQCLKEKGENCYS